MDLVTITDHDSIDGCLELLDRSPDLENFIIGEEVSCRFPDGDIEVHLGVYGTTEALHRELQPLRGNVFDVIACLRAHDVFFTLNHLLHFYRGQAPLASYLRLALEVPALEARNGAMLPEHNSLIEQYARTHAPGHWGFVGGSDAHTLRRIGRTWTEVPGATTAEQFMTGLREGPRPARRRSWQRADDRDSRSTASWPAIWRASRDLVRARNRCLAASAASRSALRRCRFNSSRWWPRSAARRANAAPWRKCGASSNRCSRDSAATTDGSD